MLWILKLADWSLGSQFACDYLWSIGMWVKNCWWDEWVVKGELHASCVDFRAGQKIGDVGSGGPQNKGADCSANSQVAMFPVPSQRDKLAWEWMGKVAWCCNGNCCYIQDFAHTAPTIPWQHCSGDPCDPCNSWIIFLCILMHADGLYQTCSQIINPDQRLVAIWIFIHIHLLPLSLLAQKTSSTLKCSPDYRAEASRAGSKAMNWCT